MRLQEATDALNGFGEIYMQQTKASGVIPQITGIFGTCGGGMAMIPDVYKRQAYEKAHNLNQ